MICTVCKVEKKMRYFRLRLRHGKNYRVKQCFECERERSNASKRKHRHTTANGYVVDSDLWYLPRQPWPWPPGTKVFEDFRFRNAR